MASNQAATSTGCPAAKHNKQHHSRSQGSEDDHRADVPLRMAKALEPFSWTALSLQKNSFSFPREIELTWKRLNHKLEIAE
ncbi:hypothetical protein P7K49_000914 [Saguinus oedipus]|uniref:Uncharacterized protein n=1 Tax=Saguinus oedipus TaxID=9490 RepID=A0ABQ9WFK8_SAGOE|nr:hypothetical protein P7K49_000914 [Saguinus oedipus]